MRMEAYNHCNFFRGIHGFRERNLMFSIIWILGAADIDGIDNRPVFEVMQRQLMDMFFENISLRGMIHFTYNNAEMDYCGAWPGISCTNRQVRKIEYEGLRFGNFHLKALPPCTVSVQLHDCDQKYELLTRSLPRAAENIVLCINKLRGKLDLCHLPNNLIKLNLSSNRLTGPIVLRDLPPRIKRLFLEDNCIQQDVLLYDILPNSITLISLPKPGSRRCGISRVFAADPSFVVSKSIFDFPDEKID